MMSNVTCLNCGWVHFAYNRQQAESAILRFNTYFDSLPYQKQKEYYGGIKFVDGKMAYGEPQKSSMDRYVRCMQCGGSYTNFRDTIDGDCPSGCTINPILHYGEHDVSVFDPR